ncbi:hypothetical protein Egran_02353 [Elaphomyces granulatus]|uniref:E3 ubiquitin protein ligase n=1 Tax=Elaphomyces granulatus TaxID=519963 RepID=A0A232M0J3_9EURO|nr:hypothetical protein Egran_02353 [Elaphomyces granulatus]
MTAVEAAPVTPSESALVRMEDRKRAAGYDHSDSAPPSKKQATSLNGGSKPHPDADMPWRDDLERFQKDAIWRQMQEYKREKVILEAKVKDMSKAAAYHNDHLRILDCWFKQLIDEVKVLVGGLDDNERAPHEFHSSLLFDDNENFEKHLKGRSDDIKETLSRMLSHTPKAPSEISELQSQLAKKLAEEKNSIVELEKILSEKQQLEERLDKASLRYMVAEKKLDRAKSLTVAKLEKQYLLGAQRPGGDSMSTASREDGSAVNGTVLSEDKGSDLEGAYRKAQTISEKQKEQLEALETENAKLVGQITAINIKNTKLTDDDYAHTDLFKHLKSQHEDVIKRINHLEATNVQLRQEAEKLQTERTAYRIQLDSEMQSIIAEKEAHLMKAETDLARIRNARDELLADQQMRKAAQEQEKTATGKIQELAAAREAQIVSLESELERLRLALNGSKDVQQNIDELPAEELRAKYQSIDRQYAMLNTELTSMQTVCKKYSTLASQKVADFAALEDKVQRLIAEKSKADQKYFAAMKSKEARDSEVRILRIQNSKSSDIVTQLKESEAAMRSLLTNMEKQVSEGKEALHSAVSKHRSAQQQITESNITVEGLKAQITELKNLSKTKDSTLANTSAACRKAEAEVEGLKSTLADTKKSLESWKTKSLGNSSSEYEMLRTLALCTVCRRTFKDTVIKTCGHVFCRECVEERLISRLRKCPNCNKAFGNNDYMHITL